MLFVVPVEDCVDHHRLGNQCVNIFKSIQVGKGKNFNESVDVLLLPWKSHFFPSESQYGLHRHTETIITLPTSLSVPTTTKKAEQFPNKVHSIRHLAF